MNETIEYPQAGKLKIVNVKPDYNMLFHKDDKTIGKLDWNSGVLKFEGEIEESAKVFFEFLKNSVDDYIKEQLKEKV